MSNKQTQVSKSVKMNFHSWFVLAVLVFILPFTIKAQGPGQSASGSDDSNVRPLVTAADLQIVKRARAALDSPSKWNRADNRECPAGAKTYSLYCALEQATVEVNGNRDHRGAALQEMRFVIDEIAGNRNYDHRLMRYNNDPTTTFADVQEVFSIVERLITLRLKGGGAAAAAKPANPPAPVKPEAIKAEIEIAKRARQMLDSETKWDRHSTQECPADAKVFGLYCALVKAAMEINGVFDDDGAAITEARHAIRDTAPNAKIYKARLVDFNNDRATTLADVQKLLQLVEDRLQKQLAEAPVGRK